MLEVIAKLTFQSGVSSCQKKKKNMDTSQRHFGTDFILVRRPSALTNKSLMLMGILVFAVIVSD